MNTLFHLAFPAHDLDLAKDFYHHQLGFALGRESENALILNFSGHQIVAHLVSELPALQESIYPRHFGLIFREYIEFEAFIEQLTTRQVSMHIPLKTRFPGTAIEHQSFFLKDPSNNLLEFKYYKMPSAIFGEKGYKRIGDTAKD